jgi:hypothetical protein
MRKINNYQCHVNPLGSIDCTKVVLTKLRMGYKKSVITTTYSVRKIEFTHFQISRLNKTGVVQSCDGNEIVCT